MQKVAVLGAGPMGLAAAYHLTKAGMQVVVFERDAEPGGMSASFDFDGVLLEKYYHFINLPDVDFFALLQELGMEQDLRWTETHMGFFRPSPLLPHGRGRILPWGNPLALLTFKDVPLMTRLRYGVHAFSCKFIRDLMPLDDISAKDWICRWEGEEGYALLWRTLFEKKFFELSHPLSAAWIASRIRRVANSRKSLMQEHLGYLEGGSASFISRLVQEIQSRNGELLLERPVRHVDTPATSGGKFCLHTDDAITEFDAVISTIPLPYICKIIKFDDDYAARIAQIRNIGVVCVVFRLKQPVSSNFWLNIDMPGWDIPGIIEYSNLRPMQASYVYVPFYMPHSHANWDILDEVLITKARNYLASINCEAAKTEEAVRLFRYEFAQPVCPPGFRHVLPPYATGIPRLLVADTTHSFPEDRSIQESVRIGRELSEQLLASY